MMNKKISAILGIALFIALLIAAIIFVIFQYYLPQDREIEIIETEKEEWKIYRSEAMNFEISYPEYFNVSREKNVSTGVILDFLKEEELLFTIRSGGYYSQDLMRMYTMDEWIEFQDGDIIRGIIFGAGDYEGISVRKNDIETVYLQKDERNFFEIYKGPNLSISIFQKMLDSFRFFIDEEKSKELKEDFSEEISPSAFSPDEKLSAYIKNIVYSDKAIMEIYIRNEETKEENVIRDDSCFFKKGFCPWPCRIGQFSLNNKYIIRDCGTSPERILTVINVKTGEEMVNFESGSFSYYWLNDENIIFDESQFFMVDSQNQRPWGSGAGSGIAKINILSDEKIILKKSDDLNDYFLVKLLDNGNILFTFHIYPNEGDWERFLNPSISHWIMDINGNIIEEIYNLEKYKD